MWEGGAHGLYGVGEMANGYLMRIIFINLRILVNDYFTPIKPIVACWW